MSIERMCWEAAGGGKICGGVVSWSRRAGRWVGACSGCGAGTIGATAEQRELDEIEQRGSQ